MKQINDHEQVLMQKPSAIRHGLLNTGLKKRV